MERLWCKSLWIGTGKSHCGLVSRNEIIVALLVRISKITVLAECTLTTPCNDSKKRWGGDEIANFQKEKNITQWSCQQTDLHLLYLQSDDEVAEQLISLVGDKIEITDVIQKEKITKPDLPLT